MKQVVSLVLVLLVHLAACRNVVIENNKFFVDGTEFFVKGVNYNPTPLGLASMGPDGYGGGGYCSAKMTPYNEWKSACYDSDFFDASPWSSGPSDGFAALWRRDFPVMKAMGANLLRLYNTNPTTKAYSQLYSHLVLTITGKDHIPFLNYAQQNGFYVMYPLYSDMWAFTNTPVDQYKRFLRTQIDEVGNHSAVLIWQFGNEMNWDGTQKGFYPYPDLMAKYNMYVQFIRQYTLSRWGRKIPITHAVIDFPETFDWLLQRFDVDIFSVNTFRGTSTGTMFPGIPSVTTGFRYGTCAWNKPLMLTEFGWNGYSGGSVNQLLSDFVSHIQDGLIGVVMFEHNDEPHKPGGQQTFGANSVAITYNGTQSSIQRDVFLPDTIAPKQIYYDIQSGKYNNINYNYKSNFFALAGRSAQSVGSSTDGCASVGTFRNCPGGNPACSGHGICDRTTGTCSCAAGWSGVGCTVPVCNCNGRGACSNLTSPPQCVCNNGFYGVNCENTLTLPSTACPNSCTSGNGVCNKDFICQCVSGWSGHDCSVVTIQNPFPVGPTPKPTPKPTPGPTPSPSTRVCVENREEGSSVAITCPYASQKITSIEFASYGLPSGTCGSQFTASSACHSDTSLQALAASCLDRNSCSFNADNAKFGDPCSGIRKRLSAIVKCSTGTRVCVGPVSENQSGSLTCPSGTTIREIEYAQYGLPAGSCGAFYPQSSCFASSSRSVTEQQCLGKSSCTIAVKNDVFTDPCNGIGKYFVAQALCW